LVCDSWTIVIYIRTTSQINGIVQGTSRDDMAWHGCVEFLIFLCEQNLHVFLLDVVDL